MIAVAIVALSAPFLGCALYLAVLALLARPMDPPAHGAPKARFVIVVPAHDEEARSLRVLDWPPELMRVVVVADNCSDRTAEEAVRAGARVLVRSDPRHRGKGYALRFAFERIVRERFADAVVVVDADTVASPNLLRALQARLDAGEVCAQVEYAVRNPDASWRTRLMVVALALYHGVRSLARERLGLSVGLRGNGMCFARTLLEDVPHEAYSLVEDVEYGLRVGLAGRRVAYVHEAVVLGEMPADGARARSQRARWEAGRSRLARRWALPLLLRAFRTRNPVLFDLAVDLVVPPLSRLAFFALAGTVSAFALCPWTAAIPWALTVLLLAGYVLRGAALAGPLSASLRALAWAPAYAAWKLTVRAPREDEWIRTRRERA